MSQREWVFGGEDPAAEGYKIVSLMPSESHDQDAAGEYVATVYDPRNVPLVVLSPDLLAKAKRALAVEVKSWPSNVRKEMAALRETVEMIEAMEKTCG